MTATASLTIEDVEHRVRDFVSERRASRPSPTVVVHPENPNRLVTISSGQTYEDRVFSIAPFNTMLLAGGAAGRAETLERCVIRRCRFQGNGKVKWGMRLYGVVDLQVEDCDFIGLGHEAMQEPDGHGAYDNLAGSMAYRRCYFLDNQGQALQVVDRESESPLPPMDGTLTVEESVVEDCSTNPKRGGFMVSLFNPGASVDIRTLVIFTTPKFPAIYLPPNSYHKAPGGFLLGDARDGTRTPHAHVRELSIFLHNPVKPAFLIEGQDDFDASGLYFKNPRGGVLDAVVHENCRRVSLRNIHGDVDIHTRTGPSGGPTTKVAEIRGGGDFEWTGQGA